MSNRIYLDNNATTPVDPRVLDVVAVAMRDLFGNPSSIHRYGQEAKRALLNARKTIADCLGVSDKEIIFTSGGTETLNLIFSGMQINGPVVTTDVEHAAVYNYFNGPKLSVGEYGAATPEAVAEAAKEAALITLMAANNETGVKTDIEAIGAIAEKRGIPFVVDGVALFGKEPFKMPKGVGAMAFSGHKFHAPKGIGFAVIRRGFKLKSPIAGGGQEFGIRSGTEALPLILGLAKAVEIAVQEPSFPIELRDLFEKKLAAIAEVNGTGPRIGNTSNLAFKGKDAETLLIQLDQEGIAVSAGSACSSGALEPSRVLTKMGYPIERVRASLRFSFSRFTTESEIEETVRVLSKL